MKEVPISYELIMTLARTNDIPSPGASSIREIVHLVNKIEEET